MHDAVIEPMHPNLSIDEQDTKDFGESLLLKEMKWGAELRTIQTRSLGG